MKEKAAASESAAEVKFVNNISLSIPAKSKINHISLIFIAFMGFFGMLLTFFSTFKTGVNISTVIYFSVLYFGVFTAVLMLIRKNYIVIIPVFLVWAFLLYKKYDEFVLGFKELFDNVYKEIYPFSNGYFHLKAEETGNMEIFLAFIILILAFGICSSVYYEPNFFIGFIFTFSVLEIGLYFGKSPKIIYALMLIIYWISLIVLKYCGHYQKKEIKKSGFIRKDDIFIAKPGIRFSTAGFSVCIMAIICCLIFALTFILSSVFGYERSEKINNLRSDVKLAAREFSFDNFDESMERFKASLGFDDFRSYTHKLGTIGTINFKNICQLTVETDGAIDLNLYLKGYTGSVYTGNEWVDFPDEIYNENASMFKQFDLSGKHPQDMLSSYIFNRYDRNSVNVTVTPKYKNEKYSYIPYISRYIDETSYTNDTLVSLNNKESYSFNVNKIQITSRNLPEILSGFDDSINEYYSYRGYNSFVHDNYLSVDDTEELQEVYDKFVKGTILETNADVYEKLCYIKQILNENATYSLSPGITPWGKDYVNYFLTERHEGYCMHFATAGAILARMSGIPSRYCDGYVVNADDFNKDNAEGTGYKIEIDDTRAHAWVEVYIRNLGWVPFEFTPAGPALGIEEPTDAATTTVTKTTKPEPKKTKTSITKINKTTDATKKTGIISVTSTESETESNIEIPLELKITFITLLLIITGFAIMAILHVLEKNKKSKNLDLSDRKKAVSCGYGYIVKLLKFCGIEKNNMQYLDYAKCAAENLPDIVDDKFENITHIMLKAQLSETSISIQEAQTVVDYYKNMFEKIYVKSGILKKVDMRFIKNL